MGVRVMLDGQELEEVSCFKYLGAQVAAEDGVGSEVNHRVKEAVEVQGAMRDMWKVRSVGMNAKRRMYESIVVPTALYGAETWAVNGRERKKLDVMEMRSLRSICGVTIRDRIRNEEIRGRTGVRDALSKRADQTVLRWFGHIERMSEERMVKRIYKSEAVGARARGRPRVRWKDGVKRILEEKGMTVEQGRLRTCDRGYGEIM